MSSSENDEDVLVTTEPIPVIFHRLATGNRNTLFFFCLRLIFVWLLGSFVFWFPLAHRTDNKPLAFRNLVLHPNFLSQVL